MHLDEGGQGGEGTDYYLKPMNCPFHILIFRSRTRSYRELPLRMFEFGSVYRYEKSGVVHGLTRVRGMTQDDAHIFCTKEQMADELGSLLDFVLDLLRDYGLDDFYLELSTKPPGQGGRQRRRSGTKRPRRCGSPRPSKDLDLVMDPGGGAFYGPKISVQARDAIGRTWQMSTIQLDFQTPATLRPPLRRRRQRASPPGDDPPRAVRFDRALLRACSSSTTRVRSRCGSRRCRRRCSRSPTATTRTRIRIADACGPRATAPR